MRNKISITTLKEIENKFGEFDVGQTFGSNKLYLRFGYWKQVDTNILQDIIGLGTEVVEDDIFDDDCGYKFSYKLV